MAWLIVCFVDQTVSLVSENWVRRNGKKCYFPKTNIAMKIKQEAVVDENSDEWALYSCRILMHGEKYATLKEARKAEKIAQNHSTMTSFEKSYDEKQKSRKHPNVFASASEDECDDFNIIDKLKKLDSKSSSLSSDKEYTYKRSDSTNDNDDMEGCQSSEDDAKCSDDEDAEGAEDDEVAEEEEDAENDEDTEDDEGAEDEEDTEDDEGAEDDEVAEDDEDDEGAEGDEDAEYVEDAPNNSEDDFNLSSNDVFESQGNESNFLPDNFNNLESTSELRSPAAVYDFSDDRCLVRIEKLVTHACQELVSIKNEMKALNIKSSETEQVVEKLALVCKDLTVEVFSCTEELKKRNGMFTDLLVPDLKLPVFRRKDYKKNELALEKIKIADNMIKYLASTINEKKEKSFIRGCFNAIFDTEFLTNKVWWKSEPGKVLIKKSQILHCMKESFKLKYGLVEPRKTDKEIEKLIYNTCRNIKDSHRKALKKAAEEATKFAEDAVKAAEKAAKRVSNQVEVGNVEHTNESDWNYEDHENYKNRKKAKKAARQAEKAKLAAEELNRTVEKAYRAAEQPTTKLNRKRSATRDDIAAKKKR